MGKQRMVDTDFWSDTFVVDHLSLVDRYLFIYLFTNPHTNVAGVYELSLRLMSFETGIEQNDLATNLARLQPKVTYKNGWVILRNGVKNQNYKSPLMQKAILTIFEHVPSELLQHVSWPNDFGKSKPKGSEQTQLLDTVPIGYTYQPANNNNNYNSNNNDNSNDKPPTPTKPKPAPKPKKEKGELVRVDSKEIDTVLEHWKAEVGLELGAPEKQRKAISKLLKERGLQKTLQLVKGVARAVDDRYAPRIADFPALYRKQNDLILWGRKQSKNSNVEVIS